MKLVIALVREFAFDAAATAGASGAKGVARFVRRNNDAIVDAFLLYRKYHKVNRLSAFLIACGVRNARLRNAIQEIYRYSKKAQVADGSTMAALENEVRHGIKVGGRYKHLIKAEERRESLTGPKGCCPRRTFLRPNVRLRGSSSGA